MSNIRGQDVPDGNPYLAGELLISNLANLIKVCEGVETLLGRLASVEAMRERDCMRDA